MNGIVLVVDFYAFQPLRAVHEMVLGDVERQSVDGGHVKDIFQRLVVLIVLLGYLPYLFVQE